MSNKQCPKCKSYHTKKMVNGRANNVINVCIVIMDLRIILLWNLLCLEYPDLDIPNK